MGTELAAFYLLRKIVVNTLKISYFNQGGLRLTDSPKNSILSFHLKIRNRLGFSSFEFQGFSSFEFQERQLLYKIDSQPQASADNTDPLSYPHWISTQVSCSLTCFMKAVSLIRKHYITSAKARLQSPAVSVKACVCVWLFIRVGSKTWLQSMLLSAIAQFHNLYQKLTKS